MKKIIVMILALLVIMPTVFAATDLSRGATSSARVITPDESGYWFQVTLPEFFEYVFASKEKKTVLLEERLDKRRVEYQTLAAKIAQAGQLRKAERVLERQEEKIEFVEAQLEKIQESSSTNKETKERIRVRLQNNKEMHIEVKQAIQNRVTIEIKEIDVAQTTIDKELYDAVDRAKDEFTSSTKKVSCETFCSDVSKDATVPTCVGDWDIKGSSAPDCSCSFECDVVIDTTPSKVIACPADAKICPDGTQVFRDPKNDCKFDECSDDGTGLGQITGNDNQGNGDGNLIQQRAQTQVTAQSLTRTNTRARNRFGQTTVTASSKYPACKSGFTRLNMGSKWAQCPGWMRYCCPSGQIRVRTDIYGTPNGCQVCVHGGAQGNPGGPIVLSEPAVDSAYSIGRLGERR